MVENVGVTAGVTVSVLVGAAVDVGLAAGVAVGAGVSVGTLAGAVSIVVSSVAVAGAVWSEPTQTVFVITVPSGTVECVAMVRTNDRLSPGLSEPTCQTIVRRPRS